uniref:Uncharacterized protein n=1 Tax=Leersia perrieri TaxID=77586 RepID=A0A0D9WZH9_9ORYZ
MAPYQPPILASRTGRPSPLRRAGHRLRLPLEAGCASPFTSTSTRRRRPRFVAGDLHALPAASIRHRQPRCSCRSRSASMSTKRFFLKAQAKRRAGVQLL